MTRTTTSIFLLCAALAAGACRGGGSNADDTGDDAPDASVNPDDVEIYAIQQDDGTLLGTEVNIRGVVVTAIDEYGERVGNIWVQEPAGGAYSGVLVYGIALGTVADLDVGDVIDLEHVVVDEFALTDDTSGRTTTEMTPPDGGEILVTVISQGEVPAPEVVDALAIGQMATPEARDAEWEKWEGVLITLENVSVLDELDQIGSTPQDPPFEEIQVTGPMRADTSLASIAPVTRDDCLASVTGIGDYFFNYKILPRETAAIVTGGTGCPAQEADGTACDDGIDNEADGFADCADFSCQAAVAECAADTTIAEIQAGTATGTVSLNDVVITAISRDLKHLWVAQTLTAAANEGIYVYRGSSADVLGSEFAVGATVDVTGTVAEFDVGTPPAGDTLTELTFSSVTFVAAPASAPAPVTGQTPGVIGGIATGEPYESVLVQFSNLEVMSTIATGQRVVLTDGTTTIVMDDDIYDYSLGTGTDQVDVGYCFTTITGVMNINLYDDERRFLPRTSGDLVRDADGSDCN